MNGWDCKTIGTGQRCSGSMGHRQALRDSTNKLFIQCAMLKLTQSSQACRGVNGSRITNFVVGCGRNPRHSLTTKVSFTVAMGKLATSRRI